MTEFDYDQQVKLLTGSLVPGQYYAKVQMLRSMLRRQVHDALGRFDVLASPTMRVTAPRIKPNVMPASKQDSADLLMRGPDHTPLVPLSNVTAMNVPCGFAGPERWRDADRTAAYRAAVPGGRDSGRWPTPMSRRRRGTGGGRGFSIHLHYGGLLWKAILSISMN